MYGKFSSSDNDVVMIELADWWPLFLSSLPSTFDPSMAADVVSRPLEWATNEVIFNCPPERFSYYSSSSFSTNAVKVVAWASDILFLIGFNQVSVDVSVLETLYGVRFASSFLGLVLNMIILLLVGISILLIYSLFVVSVESRTFELGIFRMVGLSRGGLVQMLLVRCVLRPPPPPRG